MVLANHNNVARLWGWPGTNTHTHTHTHTCRRADTHLPWITSTPCLPFKPLPSASAPLTTSWPANKEGGPKPVCGCVFAGWCGLCVCGLCVCVYVRVCVCVWVGGCVPYCLTAIQLISEPQPQLQGTIFVLLCSYYIASLPPS